MQDMGVTAGVMQDGVAQHGMSHGGMMPSMALVPLKLATHTAITNGRWDDPTTWAEGTVPGENARVVIPQGVTVTVDSVLTPAIKTVRADGVLTFATDVNTQLRVDTLVTTMTGELRIGTRETPVAEDVAAKIIFADLGEISRDTDPSLIGRGALLHGKTSIEGARKDGFLTLAEQPSAGAQTITLSQAPIGWRLGDEITIAGTDPTNPASDEVRTITGIDGPTLTLDRPLDLDHVAPMAGFEVHVANLTRNVTFSSESLDALSRGHVMFMHTNDVDARFVAFEGLGRTNKQAEVDDWRLLTGNETSIGAENIEVEELGGTNVRGRYSVHFHRGGAEGEAGLVEGAVVRDDPGWAYVNHSSNVDFIGNVSHNIIGAAYNTEAGDEVGSFVGNIAIRTVNPSANLNPANDETDPEQAPDARLDTQDYGFQGDGFWFHGSGVTVEDNVVSGATGHAYIYWQLSLAERGLGNRLVDVAQLPNGEMIGPDGTLVRTKHVPVPSFDGNDAYGVSKGLQIHYLHTDNRDDLDAELVAEGVLTPVPQAYEETLLSTFSDSIFWNTRLSGVEAPYATRLVFDGFELHGIGAKQSVGIALDHFANANRLEIRNVDISGFETGIEAPRQGLGVIDNATIAAVTDIRIALPVEQARDLAISNVTFGPLDERLSAQADQRQNILMDPLHGLDQEGGLFEDTAAFTGPDFVSEMMAMEAAPFVSSTMAMADVMAMDVADGYGATGVFNVAFFGDSITDWEDSFVDALVGMVGSDITLNNFAAGGAGITPASGVPLQDRDNLTELIASVPELVWIMIGGNDILGGATAADYETALDAFVAQLSGLENAPNIVIAAQPPFFAVPLEETGGTPGTVVHQTFRDEWIPAMQRVAANYGATFFDLNSQVTDYPENYPDTLHPNAAGAQSLANLIAPELLSALPAEPFAGGTLPAPGRPAEEEDRDLDDEDDEDDEVFDDENEEEVPDGYTATLVPSRITLDLDGSGPQGLYFAQQAPDFVPIPVGSELAQYLPAEIVGLTNAELQALYGASFSGFVLPSDARSIPEVSGGFIAAAPPAFETFPFPLDPRFDLGGGGMDDDGVEVSEADAAMLARFYIVFYGRMPDEGGFENWITAMEADPTLDENGLARAFAEAEEFQILYGGLAPGDLVQALYQNALNRAPDPEGGAFWEGVLIEDPTLGAMDLALAFVMAEETQALYAEAIDAFLHGEDGMAMEDGEDEDVGEPEEAVIVATSAAEVFQVTEETPFLVIDGFDPSLDRLDLSALSTSFDAIELESTEAGTYMAVNDLEVLLEGVAASSIGADVLIF